MIRSTNMLSFVKMHGAGNDFVLIDGLAETRPVDAELARRLADRRFGVGADQILRIERGDQLPFAYKIFNADGSVAGQCGNGARCIGAFLHQHYGLPQRFSVESPAGVVEMRILDQDQVEVGLGRPRFAAADLPTTLQLQADGACGFAALGRQWQGQALSLGNPHLVIEVDELEQAPLSELGQWLAQSGAFPDGCNLGMVQRLDSDRLALRVFERGVGETLACGSGACAAAISLLRRGRVQAPVRLLMAGGELQVRWAGDCEAVYLAGPARFVFRGSFYIDA